MDEQSGDLGLIGGRYRLHSSVGRGGMAEVFRATDTASGAVVAVKRLHASRDAKKHTRAIAHLEREFHTLCQLAHPHVVTAYDYGVDEVHGPFYTMELLDGGDLEQRAPLDYKIACAFARDACSALALLHLRRLVHRDLSPRNVRCTSDGRAKLIDFGAMEAMGPSKTVVGTPPMCAPEIVRMQELDARTDLYALGATLYSALTGRYAYPARSFRHLEEMWQQSPPPPSHYVAGIPPALDALVMDLLQLEPAARPRSAGEVMQRLSAIAGLPCDELHQTGQAYLSTPRLIGREVELEAIRKRSARLRRKRGGAVVVEGAAGAGRTRMLDACVIEGKLAGASVARADATDGVAEEFGVIRALVGRVLHALPESVLRERPVLGPALLAAWPELQEAFGAPATLAANAGESGLLEQLGRFVLDLAARRPLMLVVDDLQGVDEPSLACLALLARESADHALLLVMSACRDGRAYSLPLDLLCKASANLELKDLDGKRTEELLRSVFGDIPHLPVLADRLHRLSGGRPRDLMQLAQHLVDTQLIRYEAGTWSLPEAIDDAELPQSLADALADRLRRLSAGARELAQAMAASDVHRFDFEQCCWLAEQDGTGETMLRLDELLAAGVVVPVGSQYALGQQGWVAALRAAEGGASASCHRALSRVFERRGDGFRSAQQLLLAGEDDQGLQALIAHAAHSQQLTDRDPTEYIKLLASLPAGWQEVYDRALSLCEEHGRPPRDVFTLRQRMAGAAAYDGAGSTTKRHFMRLWAQLEHDCGLDLYAALDPGLPAAERLKRALEAAQARYEALPERERVHPPAVAAGLLARAVLTFVGSLGTSLDLEAWRMLPCLRPLAALSPALEVVQHVVDGVGLRLQGHDEAAREVYLAVLDRLEQPDRAGLDPTYWQTTRNNLWYVLSTLEAGMGLASAEQWAKRLENDRLHEVNACHGQMLFHLWQGNSKRAEEVRARGERLMIQRVQRTPSAGTNLLYELPAHALADDLMRVKRVLEQVERLSRTFPAWNPVLHYARAERARIRGNYAEALSEIQSAQFGLAAGAHPIWASAAAAHVRILTGHGHHAQACDAGLRYLAEAETAALGHTCHLIRLALSEAQAQLGELTSAAAHADHVIEALTASGARGLSLVMARETRARVALLSGDADGFAHHVKSIESALAESGAHAMLARFRRLQREGLKLGEGPRQERGGDELAAIESRLMAALTECGNSQERAQHALSLLLSESGSSHGFLYAVDDTGVWLAAERANHRLPPEIDMLARERLDEEARQADQTLSTQLTEEPDEAAGWTTEDGRSYQPILLGHDDEDGFAVTGLGVLEVEPDRQFRLPALLATCLSRATTRLRETRQA